MGYLQERDVMEIECEGAFRSPLFLGLCCRFDPCFLLLLLLTDERKYLLSRQGQGGEDKSGE